MKILIFFLLEMCVFNTRLLVYTQYTSINITSGFCSLSIYQYCHSYQNTKYRTTNGTCNNYLKPWLGAALTPMKRFNGVTSAYSDKIGSPRTKSIKGKLLPHPRTVATSVLSVNESYFNATVLNVIFGQLLKHDLALSPQPKDTTGRNMQCSCNDTKNPLCMVVQMPTKMNQEISCLAIPRTASSNLNWNCFNSFREQINKLTSWLDLSQLYGSNEFAALSLRNVTDSGFLNNQMLFNRSVFMAGLSGANQCLRDSQPMPCFNSGEERTNENTALTALQTIFLRQHNSIAQKLQSMTGSSGEILFQETRRILIAQYQHIIYNEYLPTVIGSNLMAKFGLYPLRNSTYRAYDATKITQITNEFTTAAFRFGHGMVPSQMYKSNVEYHNIATFNLSNLTYSSHEAYVNGGLDAICRGSIINPSLLPDSYFGDQLANHLFDVGIKQGNNLIYSLSSINIQRGRDHGLLPYNNYRASVGLNTAKNFSDLLTNMSPQQVNNLQNVYANVNDIDLYAGGMSEQILSGAMVGQTFGYMIATMFSELKAGDRFYYENSFNPVTHFDKVQINEIQKITIAKLICDNIDINTIQMNPFLIPNNQSNVMINCESIPAFNYSLFAF